jgi:glycerol-3-phosphate dehydrogenase (NAD(P)+)
MEMSTYGRFLGAKRSTFYGLAGVGDLVATCTSKHSRNRLVGEKIAKGTIIESLKKEMKGMVAEGIQTTKAVYEFSKKNKLQMPLTKQAYEVMFENKDLKKAISDLLKIE